MTCVQIIRDTAHAHVFVRGENGACAYAVMRRDVPADSKRIAAMVRRVERRARGKR